MKTAFYTIISNSHYAGCRTDEFIASFKHFHPDIDLIVFGQKEIDEVFDSNSRLNFYNCKATFAKLLYHKYDLVVNIDADHLIFARLDEILEGDYEVAAPTNHNVFQDSYIVTESVHSTPDGTFSRNVLIPPERYLQGGLIAATDKRFWDFYEYGSILYSNVFGNKENDVLNIIAHMTPFELKVLDGAYNFNDYEFKCYYGCASLGREGNAVVQGDKIMLDGKQIKAYHFARGGIQKPHASELFSREVTNFIYSQILKP